MIFMLVIVRLVEARRAIGYVHKRIAVPDILRSSCWHHGHPPVVNGTIGVCDIVRDELNNTTRAIGIVGFLEW